jgi:hypothetical protein
MYTITLEQYNAKHQDFRSVWSSDHIHNTNYNGKRTMMIWDNGTCLIIEDVHFKIVESEQENINPIKN